MTKNDARTRNVMLASAIVLITILFWPAFKYAWSKWDTDPNYGHAYFVPLAAGYLVWRKRAALRSAIVAPSSMGYLLLAPAVGIHILSNNANLLRLSLIAFDGALAGLIVVFFGWSVLREVKFPLVFLLLAVPIPLLFESTTLPMKVAASIAATGFLHAVGLSVFREGTIIHLSNLSLEVATACSGLRAMVLVCTVGAFYGYVTQETNLRRWVVFLTSVPIALGANIARIIVTALLSNSISGERLHAIIHDFSGGFVFVIAGLLFVAAGSSMDFFSRYRGLRTLPQSASRVPVIARVASQEERNT